MARSEEEEQDRQRSATVVALAAIRPKDELEAMIAAQLLAAHNATMECYRRAMLREQTSDGRSENLNQANKLSQTYVVRRIVSTTLQRAVLRGAFVAKTDRSVIMHCTMRAAGRFGLECAVIRRRHF
jgi:hypothetical protein